ncbi:MAG: hypothetical protein ACI9FZ_000361 [Bacteroidia bacterium]|jgi:hypothetical protein
MLLKKARWIKSKRRKNTHLDGCLGSDDVLIRAHRRCAYVSGEVAQRFVIDLSKHEQTNGEYRLGTSIIKQGSVSTGFYIS